MSKRLCAGPGRTTPPRWVGWLGREWDQENGNRQRRWVESLTPRRVNVLARLNVLTTKMRRVVCVLNYRVSVWQCVCVTGCLYGSVCVCVAGCCSVYNKSCKGHRVQQSSTFVLCYRTQMAAQWNYDSKLSECHASLPTKVEPLPVYIVLFGPALSCSLARNVASCVFYSRRLNTHKQQVL